MAEGGLLLSNFDKLHDELIQLRKEKVAFQALGDLFEEFISRARSPEEPEFVEATLRSIVDISNQLTGADMSSLFLLNSDGVVIDSILARGDVLPKTARKLIETVLKKGLAGWVLRNREMGLIYDTSEDSRWLNLPDQPYFIRSALALPIVSGDMLLGILTLMHSKPCHFKPEAAELMKLTANQLALVLENAYLFDNLKDSFTSLGIAKKKIETYSKALERELKKGYQIQKDFLPRHLPSYPNWSIKAYFQPAWQVSGDFYDVFDLQGGYIGLVVGDVCDKGVGSALFMALFRSLIRIFSGQAGLHALPDLQRIENPGCQFDENSTLGYDSAAVLNTIDLTNNYIAAEHSELCMFATIFFCVLKPATGKLIYVNAGHEPAIILDRRGVPEWLSKTGPAVGLFPNLSFTCRTLHMNEGDILLSYTDGVPDARDRTGRLFSRDRLLSLLKHSAASESDLIETIQTALHAHIGSAPPEDDITILTVQRKPL